MGLWDASQCCSGMMETAYSAAQRGYMQFAHAFNLNKVFGRTMWLMIFTKLALL